MSHADILDIDRGHISKMHRHKNNKKIYYLRENGKKPAVARVFATSCHGARTLKVRFPTCVVRTLTYLMRKAIWLAHIFDTGGFACKRSGGLPSSR